LKITEGKIDEVKRGQCLIPFDLTGFENLSGLFVILNKKNHWLLVDSH
jgi:hypothetical protein